MTIKKSLFLLALCALAVAGLLVSLFLLDKAEDMSSLAEANSESVYVSIYTTQSQPVEMRIKNAASSYTLRSAESRDGVTSYLITGIDEDIPLYGGLIASYFSSAGALNAYTAIEAPGGLQPFGLDQPSQVEIDFADGSSTTLRIGGQSPDSSGVYVTAAGDNLAGSADTVYLTDRENIIGYLQGPMDFVYPVVTSVSSQGMVFDTLTFSGGRLEEPVVLRRTEDFTAEETATGYDIIAPIRRPLDLSRGLSAIQYIFGITAADIAVIDPSEESLAQYGLAEPYSTVEATGTGEGDFTLFISKPGSDGYVYLMRGDIRVIYRVDGMSLPWLGMSLYDFMSKNVLSPSIANVASVDIISPDAGYSFALSGEGEDISVSAGDKVLALEEFRPYYQTLAGAVIEEYDPDSQPAGIALLVTYHYKDGTHDTLSYAIGESGWRILTAADGSDGYLVSSLYVERVLQDAARLMAGEAVTSYFVSP